MTGVAQPGGSRPKRPASRRSGWLRAAVLGAEDGLVSTASLMIGVSASSASASTVLIAGLAGVASGAFSMAAGEYVSVSSQVDAERADIATEKCELARDPTGERRELADIYRRRGLDAELAGRVATQLMARDRLRAHLRDELGLSKERKPRPVQAAAVSAASFASLALLPILGLLFAAPVRIAAMAGVSLLGLATLGVISAKLGGAPAGRAAFRVALGGSLAMAATAGIGRLVRAAIGS